MKKMKKSHKRRNKPKGRRNAAALTPAVKTGRWRPRMPRRAAPPPWHTLGAAVAGSVGSAVASGLIVNQKIAEPETVAMLMAVGGATAAYFTDGNVRVAATGVAAAGAGQYALAKLGRAAMAKAEREEKKRQEQAAQNATAQPTSSPAQLSAPAVPAPPPRRSATGGGVVIDLFRDAASDLEEIEEDEWRYGMRDADAGDDSPIEIDLDEAA